MELVKGLGYVALTVPEIDRSLDFYRRIAHLKVSERGTKKAFLTGGINHHWLRLEETGKPSLSRLGDRKSTRLNSSHSQISYAVFCLKKKKKTLNILIIIKKKKKKKNK